MADRVPERPVLDGQMVRVLDAFAESQAGGSVNVFDRDLRYIYAAGPGLRAAGLAPGALVGRTIAELFAPDDAARVEPHYRRAFAGERVRFDLPVFDRIYETTAAPFTDHPPAILVVVQDVTAMREEQAEHRRKNAFVAAVSHELRQPLSPLTSALAVVKLGLTPGPALEMAGIMERQLGHLRRLVDDLSDSAQLATGQLSLKRERIDLTSVVSDFVASARHDVADRRIEWTSGLPLEMEADPGRLRQVLSNLLFNAARHTEAGGTIAVTLDVDDAAATVTVADDGEGIAPALLPHVFELFRQGEGRHGRMGIGLHLVKGIVEQHGGRISAHSDGVGRGSRFVITLPVRHGD